LNTLISDLQSFYKKEFQCQDEMGPQSSRAGSRPHLHKSCQQVKDSIERGDGLSGIVADNRFFFLVECQSKNMVAKHELFFDDMLGVVKNNTHFCPLKIDDDTTNPSLLLRDNIVNQEQFVCAAPAKPEKGENFTKVEDESGKPVFRHCLVTDEWKERDSSGKLSLSMPDHKLLARTKEHFSENLGANDCHRDISLD